MDKAIREFNFLCIRYALAIEHYAFHTRKVKCRVSLGSQSTLHDILVTVLVCSRQGLSRIGQTRFIESFSPWYFYTRGLLSAQLKMDRMRESRK
jgi:hypothetical protein